MNAVELRRPLVPAARLTDYSDFKRRYSSDVDDLVEDFFVPALSRAVKYDRAVGYFTAGALARLAPALGVFLDRVEEHSAPIRVVASPNLPEIDLRHMNLGYQRRTIEEECNHHRPEFEKPLAAVTWMIEHGFMEFWLIPGYADGSECLYHEKIGVIEDEEGNYLTFEGSPNETSSGLAGNIESFPVHRSWVAAEAPHAADAKAAVDDLFNPAGQRPLRVEPFPKVLAEGLVRTYLPRRPRSRKAKSRLKMTNCLQRTDDAAVLTPPEMPHGLDLRHYQSAAIKAWFKADGNGILAMATGTGKTITALGMVERLARVYEQRPGLSVVVLVPDNSLVDMWEGELREWGVSPVCSTHSGALRRLENDLLAQRVRGGTSVAVWTADSAANLKFQSMFQDFPSPRLLIADECHAFGSSGHRKLLTDQFHYRLGLSATVERHLDPEGTEIVQEYFGEVLLDIGIAEAIRLGALCPYTYTPLLIPLGGEEMDAYARLSHEIGKRIGHTRGLNLQDVNESAKKYMRERARLLWHAEKRVDAFRDAVESLPEAQRNYSLVYIAEGESPLTGERQGPLVHEVAASFGLSFHDFVGDTPLDVRTLLLAELGAGTIDGLVAMKCLDQGIDVPTARTAHFLASTKNPRQYVQRRGRILRQPQDGSSKVASVYDYIAHPEYTENFDMERKLVAQEVLRAKELAEAAENGTEAIAALGNLLDRYNLWDKLGEK